MRTTCLALAALTLAGNASAAAERSYGFIDIASNGSITESLSSARSGRGVAVSGFSRDDRDRGIDRNRWDRRENAARADRRLEARGSIVYVGRAIDPADRPYIPSLDDVAYGGSGTYEYDYDRSSGYGGYGYGDGGSIAATPRFPSGPKIIDIETERLDRRPVGGKGIEVISNGGPKIIRIAPGYSRAGQREASAETKPETSATGYLQPWSEAWTRYCINALVSFNPELGTYLDAAGRSRFCTVGE